MLYILPKQMEIFLGFCIALNYLIAINFCWHRECGCTAIYIQVLDILFRVTTCRIIWKYHLQTCRNVIGINKL